MATKSKKKKTTKKSRHHYRSSGVRPFWSGTLSFGLVNVPVHLYPAHRTSRVSMRMVAPDGTPLARKFHCPKHGRDIHSEHLLRGYELDNGEYLIVRDEELENLEPKKSNEIDLRQFVDIGEVPPLFFERSYVLTPSGESNKAYRLLAEAMEESGLAGVATFVMRDKEYLVAILANRGILRAQTLRFADEVRSPEDIGLPEVVSAPKGQVRRFAKAIAAGTSSSLKGIDFDDPYVHEVEKLVKRKLKGDEDVVHLKETAAEEENDEPRGGDLIETIRRSLASLEGKSDEKLPSGNGHPRRENPSRVSNVADWSKDKLLKRARELDIAGRSSMTKPELVKALRDVKPNNGNQ